MIVSLAGSIHTCTPHYVELELGGVGYGLSISKHTYEQLVNQSKGRLLVHHHFGDNNEQLFGFATADEKELFTQLISISGVGPSIALAALSAHGPVLLRQMILAEQTSRIQQIKGIGKKTAQRIVLELADKLVGSPAAAAEQQSALQPQREAIEALVSLGLSRADAERNIAQVLQRVQEEDAELPSLEVLVKRALRLSQ